MIHEETISRSFRKLVMVVALTLMITSVPAALVALQAQTALTLALSVEDPTISFAALTGTLPVSEEVQGGSRLIHFNNRSAGVLSVTFEISGTPNLSLMADAAFGDLEQIFTSTSLPWTPVVTYSVEPIDGDYPDIAYTATNTNGITSTLVITYRRDVTAPISSVTTTQSSVGMHTPIKLTWFADDVGSGVLSVTLFYRREPGDWQPYSTQGLPASTISGTFVFTPTDAAVTGTVTFMQYDFATVAQDQVGNREPGPTTPAVIVKVTAHKLYLPVVLKNYPPTPAAQLSINQGSASTYNLSATLQITDTTAGDSIAQVRWKNEGGDWSAWQPFTSTLSVDLSRGNGLKTVVVQLAGAKGGVAEVKTSILLFENGDFAQGLTAWQAANDGLPAPSTVYSTTDSTAVDGLAALLGAADPSYGCSNVPIGMSGVSQTLQVPSTGGHLKFRYFMITWDGASSGSHAYDAFEVYIDAALKYDDANRNPTGVGCNVQWRVPGPQNPRPETTGWHEATLDLSAYAGQSIRVAFRNYSRFDHNYNTYTYLDDVRLEP